ncbi:hypothetical protein ANN_09255 [Periplaneta americana]|uniref:Uncharacterized protein n=1 Tax=Periplaneta americana TaxID=6978 RepID=A0ABQ8TKW2_PERAM|nr:hypothetical protein ANN_09255 [Periplaneta americana]
MTGLCEGGNEPPGSLNANVKPELRNLSTPTKCYFENDERDSKRTRVTRRDETRRDETRRDETRRDETRRDETRRDETRRDSKDKCNEHNERERQLVLFIPSLHHIIRVIGMREFGHDYKPGVEVPYTAAEVKDVSTDVKDFVVSQLEVTQPRNDYQEVLELAFLFLEEVLPQVQTYLSISQGYRFQANKRRELRSLSLKLECTSKLVPLPAVNCSDLGLLKLLVAQTSPAANQGVHLYCPFAYVASRFPPPASARPSVKAGLS